MVTKVILPTAGPSQTPNKVLVSSFPIKFAKLWFLNLYSVLWWMSSKISIWGEISTDGPETWYTFTIWANLKVWSLSNETPKNLSNPIDQCSALWSDGKYQWLMWKWMWHGWEIMLRRYEFGMKTLGWVSMEYGYELRLRIRSGYLVVFLGARIQSESLQLWELLTPINRFLKITCQK